ncbi:AraC-type DNA-binding protein [Spirosomataceae bacterium TFI 002]|nr:AraC-type DNA-binding protein [Spirosomataceae bacterium TFI 002]
MSNFDFYSSNVILTFKKWVLAFQFVLVALAAIAQNDLTISVEVKIPLLLEDEHIYMASDFNDWNPGDSKYKLNKVAPQQYEIKIKNPPSRFEYKFTQGTWATSEGTPAGESLSNRVFKRSENPSNLVETVILGWEEQIVYTVIVSSIPENTPKDASIYITGNFNNWVPNDENYRLRKSIDGSYRTIVYSDKPFLDFKFTRGSWATVEARESGKARPNRRLDRSKTTQIDNLEFSITGWEDLQGTFSLFSIYDLLLLFSVFQGILLLIAIPSIQSNNKPANNWLLLSIALSSVSLLFYLLSNFSGAVQAFPKIIFLADFIIFLYSPLYFFYLRKLLFNDTSLPSRWYFHFLPFVIQVFAYLPFLLNSNKEMLNTIMNQDTMLVYVFLTTGILGLIWNSYYWNLFRTMIKNYRTQFETNFSYEQNLNYLNTVLYIHLVCLMLWGAFFVVFGYSRWQNWDTVNLQENFIDTIWLSFSVVSFFLGYFAIHQTETFKADPQSVSIFDDILESRVAEKITLEENEDKSKHDTGNEELIKDLEKIMEEKKPFHNPKLTLSELAKQIGSQPHILSKAINEHYGKNFFDLINGYRIEEFKKLIQNPSFHNFTLLALAYEVGFNSKTAFNRSFKKATDQTPKEYFNQIKKK